MLFRVIEQIGDQMYVGIQSSLLRNYAGSREIDIPNNTKYAVNLFNDTDRNLSVGGTYSFTPTAQFIHGEFVHGIYSE